MSAAVKPLGHKSYGSTPHLPGSRLGPGDHHCHAGQATICLTKARDRRDRIIVTEKLDGSNVAIARHNGQIIALGRAGYLAQTSRFEQHQLFAAWVRQREAQFDALPDGTRIVGEWLAQAHGTRYELRHEPFVAFDLISGQKRAPHVGMIAVAEACGLPVAAVIHEGGPCDVASALIRLGERGRHGAVDPVEGAVWRVERDGEFDFIAKFVRHDKKDGYLLPDVSGEPAVWNWRP